MFFQSAVGGTDFAIGALSEYVTPIAARSNAWQGAFHVAHSTGGLTMTISGHVPKPLIGGLLKGPWELPSDLHQIGF